MKFKIKENNIIFCICGKAGSGKSTVEKYIHKEYKKKNAKIISSPYTKYLKQYVSAIQEKRITEKNKPRTLLQELSSKLIKEELNYKELFINRQIEDINIYQYFFDVITIPDVRFPKEINILKKKYKNVISIGIKRNNYDNNLTEKQKKDITETALDKYDKYDYIIENNENTNLKKEVIKILKSIEEKKMNTIIAIDGPAGSGKGTLAKEIAKKYKLVNIDTGATYRCLALKVLQEQVDLKDTKKIIDLSKKIDIELKQDGTVLLDKKDVTKKIREKKVTEIVSPISSIIKVRENLVKIQRKIAEGKDVVMEGRDITTVVFPNAQYKIYLDASIEERAKRRFKENQEKNIDMTYEEVLKNIKERDYNDTHKKVGALKRTKEQVYIDNTNLTIDEELEIIDKILNKK